MMAQFMFLPYLLANGMHVLCPESDQLYPLPGREKQAWRVPSQALRRQGMGRIGRTKRGILRGGFWCGSEVVRSSNPYLAASSVSMCLSLFISALNINFVAFSRFADFCLPSLCETRPELDLVYFTNNARRLSLSLFSPFKLGPLAFLFLAQACATQL
jgi:hypothetical protein